MERNAAPLDRCADGVSRGGISSAHPVDEVPNPVGLPAAAQQDVLKRIAAYLEALGFQDAPSRHGLVREILERLDAGPENDPEETIQRRAIRQTLSLLDHRLAAVPGLGGPSDGPAGGLARAALGDPRVRRACLASTYSRHECREDAISFPAGSLATPIPVASPTSMPEQRLDLPSLKGLTSGWRGWLRFRHALRNTLAKIAR